VAFLPEDDTVNINSFLTPVSLCKKYTLQASTGIIYHGWSTAHAGDEKKGGLQLSGICNPPSIWKYNPREIKHFIGI